MRESFPNVQSVLPIIVSYHVQPPFTICMTGLTCCPSRVLCTALLALPVIAYLLYLLFVCCLCLLLQLLHKDTLMSGLMTMEELDIMLGRLINAV